MKELSTLHILLHNKCFCLIFWKPYWYMTLLKLYVLRKRKLSLMIKAKEANELSVVVNDKSRGSQLLGPSRLHSVFRWLLSPLNEFRTQVFTGLSLLRIIKRTSAHISRNVSSDICTQRGFKSACASAPSDQNLRCSHEETAPLAIYNVFNDESDQTAQMCDELKLHWAHIYEGTFSDIEAKIYPTFRWPFIRWFTWSPVFTGDHVNQQMNDHRDNWKHKLFERSPVAEYFCSPE